MSFLNAFNPMFEHLAGGAQPGYMI